MNKTQDNVISKFNTTEYEVTETKDCESFISVIVESVDKRIFTKSHFHLFIGKRGGIRVITASRLMSDKASEKVMTSLLGFACIGRSLKLQAI